MKLLHALLLFFLSFTFLTTSTIYADSSVFVPSDLELSRGAEEWTPYPDELQAIQALAAQNTALNRAVLAESRYSHAIRLFSEFKVNNSIETFERGLQYAISATELTEHPDYWKLVGLMHYSQKDSPLGSFLIEEAFRKVLELAPENLEVSLLLAEVLVMQDEHKEALTFYEKVLQQDPLFATETLVDKMNLCYLETSMLKRGVQTYEALLAEQPDLAEVRIAMAMLLKAQHQDTQAISELNTLMGNPASSYRSRMLGEQLLAFWQTGQTGGAQ